MKWKQDDTSTRNTPQNVSIITKITAWIGLVSTLAARLHSDTSTVTLTSGALLNSTT